MIKRVAIDYKKEWKVLKHIYGKYKIQDQRGIPSIQSTLDEVMDFQIQHTIQTREKLMEKFIMSGMKTDIDGGTQNSYNVNVIFRGRLYGQMAVPKKDFDAWCKKKGGK